MKRKVWNKQSVPVSRSTGNYLSLKPKAGYMTFSRDLVKELELEGKAVNFIQDEDKPTDWYLEIANDNDTSAFPLREQISKGGGKYSTKAFVVQSTFLCREILGSNKLEGNQKFIVSTEPTEKTLYAIITKSASPAALKKAS